VHEGEKFPPPENANPGPQRGVVLVVVSTTPNEEGKSKCFLQFGTPNGSRRGIVGKGGGSSHKPVLDLLGSSTEGPLVYQKAAWDEENEKMGIDKQGEAVRCTYRCGTEGRRRAKWEVGGVAKKKFHSGTIQTGHCARFAFKGW